MPKILIKCTECGKELLRYPSHINTSTPVCSQACKGVLQSRTHTGVNNNNFGKKWSLEQRTRQSNLVKSKVTEEYRFKSGSANRGKKFSKELIDKMHSNRTADSYRRTFTDEIKKIIGQKSSLKFTPEYKLAHRKKQESKGYWIPLTEKNDYKYYRECANWIDRMFDIIEDGAALLKEHKVFNAKTNVNGVVRDHMYSRKSGFINKVFPELLRHPCNCQIIKHSDNVKKKTGRYTDADSITLDTLFNNILSYRKEWPEQQKCIQLINNYNLGQRYSKEEYISKHYDNNN
jgi:hypothetical protein